MRGLRKLAVIAAICACGPPRGPTRASEQVPTLMSGGVTRYNEPFVAAAPSPLADAILAATREAADHAQKAAPVADARLFAACDALARVLPPDGVIAQSAIEFAVHSHGIIEPAPPLIVVRGNLSDPAAIIEALRPQLEAAVARQTVARLGVGTFAGAGGNGVVVVALQTSHLRTSPIPRALVMAARAAFDITLAADYRDPIVRMMRQTGEVEIVPLEHAASGAVRVQLDCLVSGQWRIEIGGTASGDYETLAQIPVWCAAQPPASLAIDRRVADVPARAEDAEQRLLAIIDHERMRAGRLALAWDDQLAHVAREFSEDMRRAGIVSEVLPNTARLKERAEAVRQRVRFFTTVGRAAGVAEAERDMLETPSVREGLLSEAATRIGIGVVYGRALDGGGREMFVTEVLTRPWP